MAFVDIHKARILNLMDKIENKTGLMMHELIGDVEYKRLIDQSNSGKEFLTINTLNNILDSVRG